MEMTNESQRFENGGLGRECEAALVVAALQGLFLMEEVEYERSTEE